MSDSRDDLSDALAGLAEDIPVREVGSPKHGDRPCPICGALMLVENLNGADIDTCRDHGIWLDHEELQAIIASRRPMGAPRHRAVEQVRQAKRDGKVSGALLGFWSLLLPD